MSRAIPHVVIIGGGFAGLWWTRALASAPVCVRLVDKANHHLSQPLLYQLATTGLSAADIAAPLRPILRRQWDVRMLASGATHAYCGHDEWGPHAPSLKTLDDALAIRRRLLLALEQAEAARSEEERRAWLRFVIVGDGPTGVELAGTLAEISRYTLRQEFRHFDPRRTSARLIEAVAAPLEGVRLPSQARRCESRSSRHPLRGTCA